MRPNCVQEKTLSAERSTQVPTVPKGNSEILADIFSPAQTLYCSFACSAGNRSANFDSIQTRKSFASKGNLRDSYLPSNG